MQHGAIFFGFGPMNYSNVFILKINGGLGKLRGGLSGQLCCSQRNRGDKKFAHVWLLVMDQEGGASWEFDW